MPELDPRLLEPIAGKTRLVTRPNVKEVLTADRETDSRTAVLRALAEYLEPLEIVAAGGRASRFLKVHHAWAEPEVPKVFPAAVVLAPDQARYDDRAFSQTTIAIGDPADRIAIRAAAELSMPITVEAWCSDPKERMALVAMLEDAFDPTDWMSGFLLEMPHYHGSRASFLKTGVSYVDGQDSAQKRWRLAVVTLEATATQYRFVGKVPALQLTIDVQVT